MDVTYLNTDLEIESADDLSRIVEEFGDEVSVLFNGQEKQYNMATFEVSGNPHCADEAIGMFCLLVENLPLDVRKIWNNCVSRTFDIGYESGESPTCYRSELRPDTVRRVAEIGASITISIYPIRHESKNSPHS